METITKKRLLAEHWRELNKKQKLSVFKNLKEVILSNESLEAELDGRHITTKTLDKVLSGDLNTLAEENNFIDLPREIRSVLRLFSTEKGFLVGETYLYKEPAINEFEVKKSLYDFWFRFSDIDNLTKLLTEMENKDTSIDNGSEKEIILIRNALKKIMTCNTCINNLGKKYKVFSLNNANKDFCGNIWTRNINLVKNLILVGLMLEFIAEPPKDWVAPANEQCFMLLV